ncbi:serine hydrolase domain-containing protein [Exiguobacterium acetylicum]|uniref:serine hydrolase domain-containing protein n=1 Tax=Exiguobacterium acetylicum TaxID=41170 RepID=UPI001EE32C98|nr:serine hydrolase [Exiguobacterium acetylicum]
MNVIKELIDLPELTHFEGVVSVHQDGELIFSHAGGMAHRGYGVLNAETTRFGIASGAKLFTAVAILRLVEAGQLTLDQPITTILPDIGIDLGGVTVHHLLTHTSGIGDYFDEATMTDFEDVFQDTPMYRLRRPLDFLPLFRDQKRQFAAGERFHYNNAGYILLGLVIEQLTHQTFTDHITNELFARTEMTQSGYFRLDALPADTAIGHIEESDGSWRTNHYALPIIGGPDGGAFLTATDMEQFWRSLLTHQLLSETMTTQLFHPHVGVNDVASYGYGVWLKQLDVTHEKWHIMGYDPGVSFHSAYYPQSNTVVTVLSNTSDGAYALVQTIEQLLLEKGIHT